MYYDNKSAMAKSKLRLKARELRTQGVGIKMIAQQLGVSSSTTSLWCRDIELTSDQIQILEQRHRDPHYGRRLSYTKLQQANRIKRIELLRKEGIKDTKNLSKKSLFFAGISLYWAEGFKKDNQVGFANSDPDMVRFFIRWLVECCDVPKERLKFRLGVNEQYREKIKIMEAYWADSLGVSLSQFQKPFFQKVAWKKMYDNPELYRGVLRVRVSKSTDLLRKIHGWIEGLRMNQ